MSITASYGSGGADLASKPRDHKDATDLIAFPAEMSGTQAASTPEVSPSLSVGHTTAVAFDAYNQTVSDVPTALRASTGGGVHDNTVAVAFAQNQAGELREGNVFNTLNTNCNASGRNTPLLRSALQVRRLTPIECERLQGFPDNYTQIPWRNKTPENCPDGPRYKAMGNSMAVPVMRWIGERIKIVDEI
jgi:DNA (cytosine-5)-methyltransferase 1